MRALVLGVATLTLSAGVASAQAVYPSQGDGPYGYGYTALLLCRSSVGDTAWVRATELLPSQRRRRSPAITQRSQSWFRSRYMTTRPVIGGAKGTFLRS